MMYNDNKYFYQHEDVLYYTRKCIPSYTRRCIMTTNIFHYIRSYIMTTDIS